MLIRFSNAKGHAMPIFQASIDPSHAERALLARGLALYIWKRTAPPHIVHRNILYSRQTYGLYIIHEQEQD